MVAILITACKDDELEALKLSRQFRPSEFDLTNGETTATVSWAPSLFTVPGEVEYVVELSTDPINFTDIDFTTTTSENTVTILDTDIPILTDYYARVKAVGKDGTGDSEWAISDVFRITGEIYILPVAEYDIIENAAWIRWTTEEALTSVVVTPAGGSPIELPISAEEAANGAKLVSGLSPGTSYTAEVFFGEVTKGSTTFKTKPSYDGFNIVDLRDQTKLSILIDTLPDIPSGSIVYLKRGGRYTLTSTFAFSKSVTIMSGPDFIPTLARIESTASFNIVANSVIDSIVFKDVEIKGAAAAGGSFGSHYLMNVNAVGSIGKVKFDNVRARVLRGLVRLQTATTGAKITNYSINNCVMDSIREYGIIAASSSSSVTNISVTNSTFYRFRKWIAHGVAGNSSILIDNCTLNEVASGAAEGAEANYVIDLNNNTTSIVTIRNTIIGKGWNEGAGEYVHGVRVGAGSAVNTDNAYSTSDFLSTNATYQIPGLIKVPITSPSLWANTATGDFTIVNTNFPAAETAGDQRWR